MVPNSGRAPGLQPGPRGRRTQLPPPLLTGQRLFTWCFRPLTAVCQCGGGIPDPGPLEGLSQFTRCQEWSGARWYCCCDPCRRCPSEQGASLWKCPPISAQRLAGCFCRTKEGALDLSPHLALPTAGTERAGDRFPSVAPGPEQPYSEEKFQAHLGTMWIRGHRCHTHPPDS